MKNRSEETTTNNMEISTIIIDNFYNDPYETREYALSQEFDVQGNYPGNRTKSFFNQSVYDVIQNAVFTAGGNITRWDMEENIFSGFVTHLSL